ncbi:MAG: metal-dependent transcriptional regulator [Euryarchaeota archaeon]|nr:metal-dependent transcriptional regulator [Euryarchaeota archaeon]
MSEKEEDYLKVIYQICEKRGFARSVEISEALNVRPASVTDMLKRLQDKGLINYEKYRGIMITESGKKLAKKLIHRGEIIKEFFSIFGVDEDNADTIANKVEHYIDDESFDRIEKFVKFVDSFKENPRWLEHFQEFIKTGELPECERMRQS